jgi:tellurite resistance protein TehA-like permease
VIKQRRRDVGLAAICAMLVLGVIFFGFGLASWLFASAGTAWTFWLLGFGTWLLAASIFFYFMNDPYPRHRRER